jgi:two-component system chemotaxis response regulator CheY
VKFLVADDDATSRLITQVALRSLGHECRTVSDGAQAWEAFRADRPDVVISDWMMPGLTGLQLCRDIRADVSGHYVYFIMVSRQGGADEIVRGMDAGADNYLVKPLDHVDLKARLIAAERVTSLHNQLAEQRAELESLNGELASLARRDPLTGLGNRRAMDEDLGLLEARVSRYGHSYCVVLLDVDHFKSYNDSYGHQAGDEALQAIATQLAGGARSGDSVYRYGGEEFLCIFPEQSLAGATHAVERMRTGVSDLRITHSGSPQGMLTVSAGIAFLDTIKGGSVNDVVRAADEALYRAKELGRNRVEHIVHEPGLSGVR